MHPGAQAQSVGCPLSGISKADCNDRLETRAGVQRRRQHRARSYRADLNARNQRRLFTICHNLYFREASRLISPGVISQCRCMVAVMWLWLEKPVTRATLLSDTSAFNDSRSTS